MTDSEDRLVGATVDGRFRLDRLLGAGGMGKVYHGVQLSVGRPVAVKVLRSDLSDIPSLQQRFFREARVLASLDHPNIVGLVDFGHDEELGALYIVMQYVDGRSLNDLLTAGRPPLGISLSIARQICSGLAEAHAAGIIHRDLKPDNVMLQTTAEGSLVAKILDFGIALPTGKDETRFTATGGIVGTPYYMSPEQAQDGTVGPASDLYAVGVILYEMLTGTVPFSGDTPLAVLFKTVNQRHTPIQELLDSPNVRGPIADLVDELLEKDASGRPASASDVARRFDALRGGVDVPPVHDVEMLDTLVEPAPIQPRTPTPRQPIAAPSPAEAWEHTRTAPNENKGSKALLLVLLIVPVLLVLLLILVMGGVLAYRLQNDPEPPTVPVAQAPETETPTRVTQTSEPSSSTVPPPESKEPSKPPAPAPAAATKPSSTPKPTEKKPKKPTKPRATPGNLKPRSADSGACQNRKCAVSLQTKDAHYACQSATCEVDCAAGGCGQVCQAASTCTFYCSGGGCRQSCFAGTNCTLSCSGGDCDRTLFPGANANELD